MGTLKRVVVERGALLGKYRLLELLGTGGMAEVWKAKSEGPAGFQRVVVVKRVLPHLGRDEAFVNMFVAEARLSAKLIHPNIVQVFELGTVDDEYFMAMEYIDGADLGQLMREKIFPKVGVAASIMQNVGRALAYAHELKDDEGRALGLVHRDVTPSNVLIGRDGTVRLLDFGIAKAMSLPSERLTETGALKGKRGYMAPEQLRAEPLDHRADIFAAGVVLHELLTHKRLFKGATDYESLSAILSKEIPNPSAMNPEVPVELGAVVLRALERNRDARFPSAEAFVEALEPFTVGFGQTQVKRAFATHFAVLSSSKPMPTLSGVASQEPLEALTSPDALVDSAPDLPLRGRSLVWPKIAAGLLVASLLVAGVYGWRQGAAAHVEVVAAPVPARPRSPDVELPAPIVPIAVAPVTPGPAVPTVKEQAHVSIVKRHHAVKTTPTRATSTPPRSQPQPPRPAQRTKSDTFDPDSARVPH